MTLKRIRRDDQAVAYYVNMTTGDDGNDGLGPTTAWATWGYADTTASVTDVVEIHTGQGEMKFYVEKTA